MTPSHAELLALVDILREHIARLEARLAEVEPPKPRVTVNDLYPEPSRK